MVLLCRDQSSLAARTSACSQSHDQVEKSSCDIGVEVVLGQALRDATNIFLHSTHWLHHKLATTRFQAHNDTTDSAMERICFRRVTATGSSYLRR